MVSQQLSILFPRMDPELRQILSAQKEAKQYAPNRANVSAIRKGFKSLTARWHNATTITNALEQCRNETPWSEHMITVPTSDGYAMPTKLYRPVGKGSIRKVPIILLVHGGGFCLGGLDTDEFIAQYLCSKVNALVINIQYRLSPEAKYPIPTTDTYDAMKWIHANAGLEGSVIEDGDLEKGLLGCGVSAGGNLLGAALWLAAEEKQRTGKNFGATGVMMIMTGYPFSAYDKKNDVHLDLYPGLCKSWTDLENAPIANKATMPDYVDIGSIDDITSPMFSLLNIPPNSPVLEHLTSRWYHQLGGLDPWRDSSRLWLSVLSHGKAELLDTRESEIRPSLPRRPYVKVNDYDGLPHTWWSVFPQVSRTKQWMADLAAGAIWALGDKSHKHIRTHRDLKL